MSGIDIVPLAPRHHAAWEVLFAGYGEFYKVDQTPAMRETVWGWLHDPAQQLNGLIAEREGVPVGLAHWRLYLRPSRAATGLFLDDLFVDPASRGSGAARALIEAVTAIARDKGCGVVRWQTADNNHRARTLYDRVATRTMWVTYDITL
jgi:GNAT superfamily N-acetyltransferase